MNADDKKEDNSVPNFSEEKVIRDAIGIHEKTGVKTIRYLSSMTMGGSFTAIVTFKDTKSGDRDIKDSFRDQSKGVDVGGTGVYQGVEGGGGVGHSSSSSNLKTNDDSEKKSSLNIEIEFISQGAIPLLQRSEYTSEEKDLNPALVKGSGKLEDVKHELIKGKTEKLDIHDERTIMAAMEDFLTIMRKENKSGIPVSFGYEKLTEKKIREIINAYEEKQTKSNTKPDATSTTTTTTTTTTAAPEF